MQTAKIIIQGDRIIAKTPYNAELVSEIKAIPGKRPVFVDGKFDSWSVPAEAEQSLREIVRKYFLIEGEKAEYEILRLKVCGESSASRSYQGGVEVDGYDLINTMNGRLREKSPAFEILKSSGGFVKGDGFVNLKRQSSHAFAVEYVVEIKVRKGAKIERTGRASHWGSFEVLGRVEEKPAEDQGSSSAAKFPKSRKAKALSPDLAALQLPEGMTVRNVGGMLKVVPVKAKKNLAKAA